MAAAPDRQHIVDVTLDEGSVVRWNPEIDHERKIAIYDLLQDNRFAPVGDYEGPYAVHLSVQENRLIFDISAAEGSTTLGRVALPLSGLRRVIKDYFTVCDSYFTAIKSARPGQIEALDMGRRGLHTEGSEILKDRLVGKIDIDIETARRLFTLICVLHLRV
ncbi:MAG: UPF0262 family protein [Alphaproteobacteria bacterium]|jgi:uncharacterized protein (UPF0262 family)|nr:UPF0262 family protein [Alphaproteobacteria bacterium]MDP6517647.1 UPF0262 family protein [Alphaproteobacteria bacterium]|tara:strand:+ start:20 stop:505 length:486 start_codon:yes stop_codon:yes gene_type:complete